MLFDRKTVIPMTTDNEYTQLLLSDRDLVKPQEPGKGQTQVNREGREAPSASHKEETVQEGDNTVLSAMESVKEMGQVSPVGPQKSDIHCITIIGQIEGHLVLPPQNKTSKYEHIIPQLVAIEQDPSIRGVLVVLNTVGGDVDAGLAIAELLVTISKPTVSLVLGGGHSIAIPIAVSADYSFIAPTATMTIHPIRLAGLVIGVPQTYEYLDKMQDRVIRFITEHSRIKAEEFRELMTRTGDLVRDVGTVMVGAEAVGVGLIDEVGGLSDALGKLRELIALGPKPAKGRE